MTVPVEPRPPGLDEATGTGEDSAIRFRDERIATIGGSPARVRAVGDAAWKAEVVVGVALRDQARALPACLASIAAQRRAPPAAVLILDDGSTDDWAGAAAPWLNDPRIVVARARCGSPARARNRILDLADALFPAARWVARLDADDRFADALSLASACVAGERSGAGYVLGGNRLRAGGALLARTNPATDRLRDPARVVELLGRMAAGTAVNELPSCNLLLARGSGVRYPDAASAEDHWLVAGLLLNRPDDGAILPAPFYSDYTLDGEATGASRRAEEYLRSRRALHQAALKWAGMAPAGGLACC